MNGYKNISYKALFAYIIKKLWIVFIIATVSGIISFVFTKYLVTPQYRASVRLYVNNKTEASGSLSSSDLSAAKSLVDTYIAIIESDSVILEISKKTKLEYPETQLRNMISAKSVYGTEVFDVFITGPSPKDCATIANTLADIAPRKIGEIVDGSSVKIIDRAKVPTGPVSPSLPRNVVVAFLLGMAISGLIFIILYISNTTIYSEEDIKEICTLPILGVFQNIYEVSKFENKYAKAERR